MRVEIELGLLESYFLGREKIPQSVLGPLTRRFNPVIATRVEKSHEPISGTEAPAANVEDFRLGIQSFPKQGDQLFASRLFEGLNRDPKKTVAGHHLFRAGLNSGHKPLPFNDAIRRDLLTEGLLAGYSIPQPSPFTNLRASPLSLIHLP